MIVRSGGDGTLLLITQPDHARLSATIASAWDAGGRVPAEARAAVLFAVAEHDNGWDEIDAAPMLNAGTTRPHDFMDLPAHLKRDIWPRGVQRFAADSPLAAALVAQHALTLHAHRRGDPEWAPFFTRVEALQSDLLRRCATGAGITRADFDRSYDLLYIGDVVSLVFCNAWTDPIDARGYRITLLEGHDTLSISPDPFNGTRVHFEIAAHALPDRPYRSDDELRAAFLHAPIRVLRGMAAGNLTPAQR